MSVREWPLLSVSDELRTRYSREGLWTDDTFPSLIAERASHHADLAFRIWSRQRPTVTTIGRVYERSRRFAAGLRARGIAPGDVVAFQLPNWVEAAIALWGGALAGAVLVPVVHFYGPKELGFILRESRARALVTADRFGHLDYVAGVESLRPSLPELELIVLLGQDGRPLPPRMVGFDEVDAQRPLPVPGDPDAPAVVAYTSGTTADPKGVIHTHRSLLAEVRQLAGIQHAGDLPALVGAPVAHAIGMLAGILLPLFRGRAIHLIDVWQPAAVLDAMLEADLTAGSGSTFFLTSLLDQPGFSREHVRRMRWVGLGAAPVPIAVAERAEALGIAVSRVYGATEHPSSTGSPSSAPRRQRNQTDGRPLAGVDLRIVDESGRDLPPGDPGEIWTRGPELFAGYTDPALTRDAIQPGGWFASGDIGVLDEEGCLRITDRKKDIIIRGGTNVSAAEIEELLVRMPGVAEVAVVAAPDERMGEHACAFVRMQPGAPAPELGEVRIHLERAGLARQKWPEELRATNDFPRTPSGKIKKFALRDQVRAEHARGQRS